MTIQEEMDLIVEAHQKLKELRAITSKLELVEAVMKINPEVRTRIIALLLANE